MENERKSRYELFLEDEARKAQPTKRCSKCKEEKSLGEFHNRTASKDGHASRCAVCTNAPRRQFRNREDWFWKVFWRKTLKVGDCLEWTGAYVSNHTPHCNYESKWYNVRRLVYKLAIGEVPDDMFVVATCHNPKCVRHAHLQLVNREELDSIQANIRATGDRSGARKHPEKWKRGDEHWSRIKPERLARGDSSGLRKHPERAARGKDNGAYTHPERVPRGDRHGRKKNPEKWKHGDESWAHTHPERMARGENNKKSKLSETTVRDIRSRVKNGESVRSIARELSVRHSTLLDIVHRRTWAHVE